MIINLENSLTKQLGNQMTYVASNISAGGTSSPVRNIAGFTNQWAVQIGQTGEGIAEIMMISGIPTGTQFNFGTSPTHTAGTLLYGHAQDTPLYQIHYDQVVFYRSTSGTGGSFSSLATVSITPDQLYTQYDDTLGAAGYAYYAQYYNSITTDLSGSSSIFVPGGPTFYSLQKIKQRTKDKLYSAGFLNDDSVIIDWINEAYEDLTNSAIKVNQNYMLGTSQYAFGTSGLGTITDITFKQPIKVEVTYDGITFLPSTKKQVRAFSETDYFDIDKPFHVWLGETVFEILPHNIAGTAKITYSQRFTPMVNDSDELTQTLKAYSTAFVEYCLGVAYGLDQKDAESQQHIQLYMEAKKNFISEITPRDLTGAETIDVSESISGLEDDLANDLGDFMW
ncbi:MAG: phage adaptor protein [Nitrosotalea sp.]